MDWCRDCLVGCRPWLYRHPLFGGRCHGRDEHQRRGQDVERWHYLDSTIHLPGLLLLLSVDTVYSRFGHNPVLHILVVCAPDWVGILLRQGRNTFWVLDDQPYSTSSLPPLWERSLLFPRGGKWRRQLYGASNIVETTVEMSDSLSSWKLCFQLKST